MQYPLDTHLITAASGRPVPPGWQRYLPPKVLSRGEPASPSANWVTLAGAIWYLADPRPLRGEEGALVSPEEWWHVYFDQSAWSLMGKEPATRIYLEWAYAPALLVYLKASKRQDVALAAKARAWLRAVNLLLTLCAEPVAPRRTFSDGKSLGWANALVGARSFSRRKVGGARTGPPHHLDDWGGYTLCRAINTPPKAALGVLPAHSYTGQCLRAYGASYFCADAPDRHFYQKIRAREFGPGVLAYIDGVLGPYGCVGGIEISIYEGGRACRLVRGSGVGASTAPIYGCVVRKDGATSYAAPDPGLREGRRGDVRNISLGRSTIEGGGIVARRGDLRVFPSSLGHRRKNGVSIPLPSGDLMLRVFLDLDGYWREAADGSYVRREAGSYVRREADQAPQPDRPTSETPAPSGGRPDASWRTGNLASMGREKAEAAELIRAEHGDTVVTGMIDLGWEAFRRTAYLSAYGPTHPTELAKHRQKVIRVARDLQAAAEAL